MVVVDVLVVVGVMVVLIDFILFDFVVILVEGVLLVVLEVVGYLCDWFDVKDVGVVVEFVFVYLLLIEVVGLFD